MTLPLWGVWGEKLGESPLMFSRLWLVLHGVCGASDCAGTTFSKNPSLDADFQVELWSRPQREAGNVMSTSCLESQGCHLIPLSYLLPHSSAWSSCSFCLVIFLLMVHSPDFYPQGTKRRALLDSGLKVVGGMCSLLPCGTGVCQYAFIYFFIVSVHSF